jgi:hypothetical protein
MNASPRRNVTTALAFAILVTLTIPPVLGQSPAEEPVNADTVDRRDAVGATASRAERAKNLVATNREGRLPANIIEPLWKLMRGIPAVLADGRIEWKEIVELPADLADGRVGWGEVANKPTDLADGQVGWGEVANKPADLADGQVGWGEVANKPAGFGDGSDDGITAMTVTQVFGDPIPLAPFGAGAGFAACPAGATVISGGFAGSSAQVMAYDNRRAGGNAWQVGGFNDSGAQQSIIPIAYCMTTVPSGAVQIASKGHKPAFLKKKRR